MSTVERVCSDLNTALAELRSQGFRLDSIYPADDPHTAVLTRASETLRLTMRPGESPPANMAPFVPEFVLTRAGEDSGLGRAGMFYRDLIPGRLGGRYIASHITIPEGGPVADWVHFHRITFQLIAVRRGWVRVVYEDQGEPFVMEAGDLVLQPPEIRHRVLESSEALEVVEISCPALHETFAEHELLLPNGVDAERLFGTQRFVRHVGKTAEWLPLDGGEAQVMAIGGASGGLAEACFIRSTGDAPIEFPAHSGELVFGFVLEGSSLLEFGPGYTLGPADSFVIPPHEPWRLTRASADFRLLHVTSARIE